MDHPHIFFGNWGKTLFPIHLGSHTCVTFCDQETVFEQPVRTLSEAQVEEMGLEYYNSDVHKAAFAVPQFVKKVSQPRSPCVYTNNSNNQEAALAILPLTMRPV